MTRESLLRDPTSAAEPRLVSGIDAKAVAVTFGYVQMAVLTDDGELYTCDTGFDGYASGLGNAYKPNGETQLGRVATDAQSALAPGRVDFGSGVKIAGISTGRCHAAVATTTGAMMAFGCGKLGGGDVKGLPTKVPDAPSGVYDVACGEYFTLASTDDGDLFGWGDGKSGQMGVDGKEAGDKPYKVEVKLGVRRGERVRVVSPVAGYQHALAIAVPGDDS
jgi:alpha-tubulin suppressor-like RCC1 family protein